MPGEQDPDFVDTSFSKLPPRPKRSFYAPYYFSATNRFPATVPLKAEFTERIVVASIMDSKLLGRLAAKSFARKVIRESAKDDITAQNVFATDTDQPKRGVQGTSRSGVRVDVPFYDYDEDQTPPSTMLSRLRRRNPALRLVIGVAAVAVAIPIGESIYDRYQDIWSYPDYSRTYDNPAPSPQPLPAPTVFIGPAPTPANG
jgi:hypothetical protein